MKKKLWLATGLFSINTPIGVFGRLEHHVLSAKLLDLVNGFASRLILQIGSGDGASVPGAVAAMLSKFRAQDSAISLACGILCIRFSFPIPAIMFFCFLVLLVAGNRLYYRSNACSEDVLFKVFDVTLMSEIGEVRLNGKGSVPSQDLSVISELAGEWSSSICSAVCMLCIHYCGSVDFVALGSIDSESSAASPDVNVC